MGKVYLVGAGPGNPELLTVRAARLLRHADVVVHDALLSEDILALASPGAERIDVGKRCGGRHTPQEEINRILIDTARRAKVVVRLKGGDPFVFGRGGEEALALREVGIRFEVVPGVTSAIGAAAFAGIPLTHRDLSSSVMLVTGHAASCRPESRVDWGGLARSEGTLAIYMGVAHLPEIAERLMRGGRDPQTPAAVVEWGTCPRQRTVTGPLHEIAKLASATGLGAPALVIVGEVVALRDQLGWFEQAPLQGARVLVPRSRLQSSRLVRRLSALGADVIEFPRQRLESAQDPGPLRQALDALPSFDWVMFTSSTAVERFWAEVADRGQDARSFSGLRFACMGTATERALARHRIRADLSLRTYDPGRVVAAFAALAPPGTRVLFPCEAPVESTLVRRLGEAGVRVRDVEVCRAVPDLRGADEVRRQLEAGEIDIVALPSSATARTLAAALGPDCGRATVITIGPETARTALACGLPVHSVAVKHSLRGLARGVATALGHRKEPSHAANAGAAPGRPRLAPQP